MTERLDDFRESEAQWSEAPSRRGVGKSILLAAFGRRVSSLQRNGAYSPLTLTSGSCFQCPYLNSPASMRMGKWFCLGGNGHVAKGVNAQGGFTALLKSRTTSPFFGRSV